MVLIVSGMKALDPDNLRRLLQFHPPGRHEAWCWCADGVHRGVEVETVRSGGRLRLNVGALLRRDLRA